MSSQPQPASPPPAEPARVSGTAGSARSQRRAHYRACDDQPVLVQLLPDPGTLPPLAGAPLLPPSFVSRLTDLSESGLRLRVEAEWSLLFPLDREVDLVLSLPDSNEHLRGRVVHRDPPGARGSVVVGLVFIDHDRASADRIRRHVFDVQRQMLARRRAEPDAGPGDPRH